MQAMVTLAVYSFLAIFVALLANPTVDPDQSDLTQKSPIRSGSKRRELVPALPYTKLSGLDNTKQGHENKESKGNPCSQDWELFEESCYGFGEAPVTWGDAAEMCRTVGARLVEIETSAENDFLKGQAHNKGGDSYWIGGTDVFHEGTWIWMSTRELIVFTDWSVGQPDDAGSHEDCLVLRKAYDYKWNDWPCDNKYTFICEMPADETVVG